MPALRSALLAGLTLALLTWPVSADEQTVALDETTLKEAGVGSGGTDLLEFFRRRTLSDADQAKLALTVRRLGDRSFPVREQATVDLITLGRVTRKYLATALEDRDIEIILRAERCLRAIDGSAGTALPLAAARLLSARRPPGAAEVVLNYLPFADDDLLEEELLTTLAAVGIRQGKPEPELTAALKDPRPPCRGGAALVVGRLPDMEQRTAVRALLTDREPRVRLRAAQGLIDGKDKEAVPALVGLLRDGPLTVGWSAQELLCRIAGDQSPQVSLGTGKDAERNQCRDAWDGWWKAHGAKLDLAKLDLEQRLLGLTLIVTLDGSTRGKVCEVGPDGKTRWEISDVQGPIDARVLPGNRVLIAEYYGQKVTERDWQGKVLWEHKMGANRRPIGVQRLANGNTLITTNNDIQEVTPDGKAVFTHTPPGGSVSTAEKLRNGNVIYATYTGQLNEVDAAGKQVRSVKFAAAAQGLFSVEPLPGGRYLVPLTGANKVVELDVEGKTINEVPATRPNTATKLPNGNLLVSCMSDNKVVELDRAGKVLWEQRLDGRPFRVRRR